MTNDIYGPFPGGADFAAALDERQRRRYEELGTNLEVVEKRILDACSAAGRAWARPVTGQPSSDMGAGPIVPGQRRRAREAGAAAPAAPIAAPPR